MHPSEVSKVPSATKWFRLYQDNQPVGFRKKIGSADFYSPDGYAWSGERISFDSERTETGMKDRSDFRVFDGDLVVLPSATGARKPIKIVILFREEWGVLCWSPEHNLLRPVSQLWPGPRLPVVTEILGSVFDSPEWHKQMLHALEVYSPHQEVTLIDTLTIGFAIACVGLLAGFGQLSFLGSIGPLVPSGGCLLGAILFFAVKRKHHPGWMTRSRLLSLAVRTGWLLTCVGCLAYSVAMYSGVEGFLEAREKPLAAITGIALVCWMLTFIVVMIAGDLVAWVAKGYSGEAS